MSVTPIWSASTSILPLVGRRIPIVADEYSDPEKGSGAVKITPAHDFNDFEVGRRHDLPQISVLDQEGCLALVDNEDYLRGLPEGSAQLAEELHGVDRFAARKQIVARLEDFGFLERIEPNTHMVPHGDRSGVVIEPYLTDQWYVDAKTMAQPAIAAVRSGATTFVPKNWEKTYFEWMENIQPWCISRQLWWGHQIPAWYGPDGKVFVAETEEEAVGNALGYYVEQEVITPEQGRRDGARSRQARGFHHPRRGRARHLVLLGAVAVLDAGLARRRHRCEALLPDQRARHRLRHHLLLGRPHDDDGPALHEGRAVLDRLHPRPRSRREGRQDVEVERQRHRSPAADRRLRRRRAALHAGARWRRRAATSSSSPQRVEGYRNFATKLWNACRFAEMNGCALPADFDPTQATQTLNRWIAHETARATREVTEAIEAYRFNDAAGAIYRFVWNVYCDWYLELAKPVLMGEDGAAKSETRAMVAWARDEILKLLHPFMPFITEELWAVTAKRDGLLVLAAWPRKAGLTSDEAAS